MTDQPGRQQQAFELYLSMRPRRSYRRVADQMGVSVSTVKAWSKQNHWRQRIMEREVDESRKLADQVENDADAKSARSLKVVNMAILKIAKAIAEGRVKASMGDLDRMVRLEERLTGVHGVNPRMLARAATYLQDLQTRPMDDIRKDIRQWAIDLDVLRPGDTLAPVDPPEDTQ